MIKAKTGMHCPHCSVDLLLWFEMMADSHRHYNEQGEITYEATVLDGLIYVKEVNDVTYSGML